MTLTPLTYGKVFAMGVPALARYRADLERELARVSDPEARLKLLNALSLVDGQIRKRRPRASSVVAQLSAPPDARRGAQKARTASRGGQGPEEPLEERVARARDAIYGPKETAAQIKARMVMAEMRGEKR